MNKLLLIIILAFSHYSLGQSENSENRGNHNLFVQLGVLNYGSASLNYQYLFKVNERNQHGIGAGIGGWYFLDLFGFLDLCGGLRYDVHYQYLLGRQNHFFDLRCGVVLNETMSSGSYTTFAFNRQLNPSSNYRYNLMPSIHLGYRRAMQNGKFLFRAGAGFPEFVQLSVGVRL